LSSREALAVVFGLNGPELTAAEREFFRAAKPLGFILFARNCEQPRQVGALVAALRDSVGRGDAPVLIDQEGGRVARLKPPHWSDYPAPAAIAALGGAHASEAAWLGGRLIADDLAQLGITVDCAPVLDVPVAGADPIIGDRAWGTEPRLVAEHGLAVCEGLLSGGVLPVIKHIPGHGRGDVDSHKGLPVVRAPRVELERTDFAPFRALAAMPWAMTAHILYTAIDSERPATMSRRVIDEVIRAGIGFDGVLVSDDLSMQALGGSLRDRARGALEAGCDLVLHCNGVMEEMREIADAIGPMSRAAARRVVMAETARLAAGHGKAGAFDRFGVEQRFHALLGSKA